jgi:hypothetical protein
MSGFSENEVSIFKAFFFSFFLSNSTLNKTNLAKQISFDGTCGKKKNFLFLAFRVNPPEKKIMVLLFLSWTSKSRKLPINAFCKGLGFVH